MPSYTALKSGLWVRALLRQAAIRGETGVILRKGDEDAGAIVIVLTSPTTPVVALQERRTGWKRLEFLSHLLPPHSTDQPESLPASASPRAFTMMERNLAEQELGQWIERQENMDPDLWVVELEVPDTALPLEDILPPRRLESD